MAKSSNVKIPMNPNDDPFSGDRKKLAREMRAGIDNCKLSSDDPKIGVILGRTGEGKTHTLIHDGIPYLFEKGIHCVNYFYPETSLLNEDAMEEVCSENGFYFIKGDIPKAKRFLKQGKQVLLALTNAKATSNDGMEFLEWVRNNSNKIKAAVTIDEVHKWTVSCLENYWDTNGSRTPTYKAVMPKLIKGYLEITPYVFGITATPNAEIRGEIQPQGFTFELWNEMSDKKDIVSVTGWLDKIEFFQKGQEKSTIIRFITSVKDRSKYSKRVGIIQVNRGNNDPDNWDLEKTLSCLTEHLQKITPKKDWGKQSIVILTDKKKVLIDLNGTSKKTEEPDARYKLSDSEDPAQFLLLVNKGDCGLDIYRIADVLPLKFTNKRNSKGEIIVDSRIQLCGRASRSKVKELLDSTGDITPHVRSIKNNENLSDAQKIELLNQLIEANKFTLWLPDTPTNRAAAKIFEEKYVCNTIDAQQWIESV